MARHRQPGSFWVDDLWVRSRGGGHTARYGVGKRWRACVVYPAPVGLRTKAFSRKADAQRYAADEAARALRGSGAATLLRGLTVGEVYSWWFEEAQRKVELGRMKKTSLVDYQSVWKNHVKPVWADEWVGDIRQSQLQQWVDAQLKAGCAPSALRKAKSLLSQIFKKAASQGCLENNPAAGVEVAQPRRREPVVLDPREVEALARECAPYEGLVRSFAYVGWRYGEATSLRIGDVDFSAGRARVWQTDSGGTTKTRAARTVALPRRVVADMRPLCAGRAAQERVFVSRRGKRLWNQTFHEHVFDPAKIRLGRPELRIHDLRHFAITTMIGEGVPLPVIQAQVGHATPTMTLGVYAHVRERDLGQAARVMDELVSTVCLPPLDSPSPPLPPTPL